MKRIRIFSVIFLIAFLALPMDVLACDDLKAARDAAKTARDAAEEAVTVAKAAVRVNRVSIIRASVRKTSRNPATDPSLDTTGGQALSALEKAKTALATAETALTNAQAKYDMCVTSKKI